MVTRSCTLDHSLRPSIPNPCAVTAGQVMAGVALHSLCLVCIILVLRLNLNTRLDGRPGPVRSPECQCTRFTAYPDQVCCQPVIYWGSDASVPEFLVKLNDSGSMGGEWRQVHQQWEGLESSLHKQSVRS
jgi:hypothetical protein